MAFPLSLLAKSSVRMKVIQMSGPVVLLRSLLFSCLHVLYVFVVFLFVLGCIMRLHSLVYLSQMCY